MLYRDSTYASLFGRQVFDAFPGTSDEREEAFFEPIAQPSSVMRPRQPLQIKSNDSLKMPPMERFTGISPEILDAMQNVRDEIETFSNSVQVIKAAEWNLVSSGFDNQRLVEDVYLTAQSALEGSRVNSRL